MSPFPWIDLLIIAFLIMLNGVFSMSELAIVSARTGKLRKMAEEGNAGARVAIRLAADSGKFLSTVQIGITLIGIIAGAYSGASLGEPVGERLVLLGVPVDVAGQAGFALVIVLTTYFSLVVGELVPKQIALRGRERIAALMAGPMAILAKVAAPVVFLLDKSSDGVLRLVGVRNPGEHKVTAEELHMLIAEATRSGAIEEAEQSIMAEVLKLADRPVRELMTPRTEIHWLDRRADAATIRQTIDRSPHSLMPVAQGSVEDILGVVKVREVLRDMLRGKRPQLTRIMRKAEIIPDQIDALDALRILQRADVAMALVHDEYGHFEGIVTPADLLAALVGAFVSHADEGEDPLIIEREDGSLLLSGALPVDRMAERLNLDLPAQREFATVAGYVLWVLKKLPFEGEAFNQQGWRFEIIDMDGRRIDKVIATRKVRPAMPPETTSDG